MVAGGSIKLFEFSGTSVRLHLTFALLIAWIATIYGMQGGPRAAVYGIVFIVILFACVVLHEFGHIFAARRYGIKTPDITLLPIGGVARLERIPEKPMQEFWVAVAGPAVNVVIAGALFIVLVILNQASQLLQVRWFHGPFLLQLMWVNLLIVGFNLLPAFPMDGGRVLRALLATRIGRRRATAVAANIGQAMAILFGIVGFFWNPFLIFIAIFVYLGAQSEAAHVEAQSALAGLQVRDAMMTRFRTLSVEDSLGKAVEELLAGSQQDFPVLESGRVAGILRRNDLVRALAGGHREARVRDAICRDCPAVKDTDALAQTVEAMRQGQCGTLPVMTNGELIGLLTLENISEVVMVNAALAQGHDPLPADVLSNARRQA